MSYPKLVSLILTIAERTNLGKLVWEKTETDGVYQTSFPNYSVRVWTYDERTDHGYEIVRYNFGIYDEGGDLMESIDDQGLEKIVPPRTLRNLFESARRYALGVEDALSSILSELKKDGPLADDVPDDSTTTDDDIPF